MLYFKHNQPMEAKMAFDLDKHTWRLLQSEPFFAALSRRIHKTATTAIPTAGVKLNPSSAQFEMIYNPDFFESLSDVEKLGVLKHEYYHIIFEHVTGRLPPEGMNVMWNIATDLAINSHLKGELPENCCMPEVDRFKDYPAGKSAEWYYSKLQQEQEDQDEEGSGEGEGSGGGDLSDQQFDNHDGWTEADSDTREMAKERLRQAVEASAKEAQNQGSWGSMSSDMRKKIMDMITPKIDWRKVLRYFIKTSQRANKRSTVRRINKRFPYIHAGKKVNRTAKIAISIDQSGSVSDKMLAAFFSELNGLAKLAEFTVVPFDTQVAEDQVYVWKKGQNKAWERVLCGGTCFNAPTKWVNEREFDGHIVLTDLCAPKPIASKCQRMWMTDTDNASNPYFTTNERVIAIDP
jgi:predicted metal-dependent peptidase